jgi:hypothetical protein
MNAAPLDLVKPRAPRARLEEIIPAVLRLQDGRRVPSQLQVVSSTGGLLSISNPVIEGSQVKLMFLTGSGSVLGSAEMLSPVGTTLQPFRFVSLAESDQRRLGAIVQSSIPESSTPQSSSPQLTCPQNNAEVLWIEKFRAASPLVSEPPRRHFFKRTMKAAGFITLGLAGAMYLFHVRLPW